MTDKNTHADGLLDHDTDARPVRLLVVDRQPAARKGLKMHLALEEDLEVVGEACDATEAIPLARALSPDVILMDIEMPGKSGIVTIERLRAAAPHGAVVILTLRDDAVTRERARAADAAAFVAKRRPEGILLAAIRGAAAPRGKQRRRDHAPTRREEERGAGR